MELGIIQALLQCVEKYPKGEENKEWFTRLFQDSLNNTTSSTTDDDLIYNATVVENILATLLSIDIKTIVKIRMVHKVVLTLWRENNWDPNELDKYIVGEKPALNHKPNLVMQNQLNQEYSLIDKQTNEDQATLHNHPITAQPNQQTKQQIIQLTNPHQVQLIQVPKEMLDEELIEEVEMTENSFQNSIDNTRPNSIQQTNHNNTNQSALTNEVLGENIQKINQYATRNRKNDPANPHFISKNPKYKLGVLEVSVPGENKKEQLAFVANILKLPSNSDLIKSEFINGNYWITAGFEHEGDLLTCKEKTNKKNKDFIDFIQLSTGQNHDKKQLGGKNKPTQNKQTTKSFYKKEKYRNQYNIVNKTTAYKGGFSTIDIPGNNRKEQFNYIANVLKLDPNNNTISHTFLKGKSWLEVHFNNQKELEKCISEINRNKVDNRIEMINLTSLNKELRKKENQLYFNLIQKGMGLNTENENLRTYMILDIPKEYSKERVKGALKPFGKIVSFNKSEAKQGKEIIVTIEHLTNSKELLDKWSIPIGNIMARIAPISACPEVWEDRNQFTARLYGIPKSTDTVLLMRSLKNLKPKTCYIPKCSISKKERKFAIVSFESKNDLNKACASSAKYFNYRLTWSKTMSQHSKNLSKTYAKKSYHIENSEAKSREIEIDWSPIIAEQSNSRRNDRPSSPTLSFITTTTPKSASSKEGVSRTTKKKEKGKGRQQTSMQSCQKANTTDKLIELISQISSRLSQIEENMGISCPNRS